MSGPEGEPAEGLLEAILTRGETTAGPPDEDAAELLTFLLADIRGYTTFTQQRGDQAAARLVAKFAEVVRELVSRFGGTVLEMRGDEVLCAFASPRQSLRAAVALQQRFVEETAADADLPLAVGIGIDAGEAVRAQNGYRGGALNLAARLCACAKAGEVVASPEVTHLAGTIDGIRYVTADRVSLKGLSEPIRPIRVRPDGEDPAQQIVALLNSPARSAANPRPVRWLPGPLARRPKTTVAGVVAVAALVAGTLVAVTLGPGERLLKALSENSLGVVDPHTRHIESEVAVDSGPIAAVEGFESVWTANSNANSISRVDIKTRQVRPIPVGTAPSAIAAGPDSVWVTNSGNGTVSRVDPTTNLSQTIAVGSTPGGVVVARGSVWVTNTGDGTVDRIDPNTNQVVQTIAVGGSPSGISAGHDIWVANSTSDTVTKVDGDTHRVDATIPVGHDPKGVAVVGDSVWVTNNLDGNVSRIRTSGTSQIDTVSVGPQPAQIAAIDGHVWIAAQASGSIAEIDPSLPLVVHRVRIGSIPGGIAAVGGKLWVASTIDPALHRGGTLHLGGDDPKSIDPNFCCSFPQKELLSQVYDGLVGYRHTSGVDDTAIVADLAAEIPEPVDGGRTYVFHVRTGIRWSTGRSLTVEDIRRGLERSILVNGPAFAGGIAGAGNCRPSRCSVSGIILDSRARTVTITLVRPDGNFIDDLTGSVAVPASTPLAEQTVPVPATGPYQIARYVAHKLVRLTRNPHFHPWDAAAQPDGYPDSIEWRVDPSNTRKRSVADVEAGRADWADARTADSLGRLAARFGGRLWLAPTQTVHALFLNTLIPPFSDPNVRKALAYAINRQGIADTWNTPASVTCQFIPPNMPGYRPYCPYTLQPDDRGNWSSPDYPTAQALVDASKYRGTSVTVWTGPPEAAGLAQVVAVLNQLGFHAHLRYKYGDTDHYFGFMSDTRNKVQAAFYGFIGGDASPAGMLEPFSCAAFVAKNPGNANPAGFCDPKIDRLMSQARSVGMSSPAAANDLWAKVDRSLVDASPWIPLVTPSWIDVLSKRVHNYTRSLTLFMLFDQMWVR